MGFTEFIMGFESTYKWEDPIKSGIIFGSVLTALISVCYFSLISVIAYAALTVLLVVISIKVYVYGMKTFLKKETANPITKVTDCCFTIPSEKVQELAARGTEKANCVITELRRLFLVENMLDSIKFGLGMWVLTYIGSWFNAMTLLILSWVGLFTIPKVYQNNKSNIDPILEKIKAHYKEVSDKIGAMIPHAKPAPVETKKDE